MPFLLPNQQRQSTEGNSDILKTAEIHVTVTIWLSEHVVFRLVLADFIHSNQIGSADIE